MHATYGPVTINVYQCGVPVKPRLITRIGPVTRKDTPMLEITINDTEKVKVALHPDGPVDGVPTWEIISGNSTLEADADGMGAYLISEDTSEAGPVDTVYRVTADVDMGAGVVQLTDDCTLHVMGAQATTLGLAPSSPEPK